MSMSRACPLVLVVSALLSSSVASAADPGKQAYSPYVTQNLPTHVYFGDTHLHTAASFDAGAFGARLTPRDAYRFARGEEIMASSGQPALLKDPQGKKWYDMMMSGHGEEAALQIIMSFSQGTYPKDLMYLPGTPAYRAAWEDNNAAAEQYNEPGRFTAFIGYEWTSNTGGNNLHRNVIFRDNSNKANQVEPYTTQKPLGSDNRKRGKDGKVPSVGSTVDVANAT
jgi:hypothetical protein